MGTQDTGGMESSAVSAEGFSHEVIVVVSHTIARANTMERPNLVASYSYCCCYVSLDSRQYDYPFSCVLNLTNQSVMTRN